VIRYLPEAGPNPPELPAEVTFVGGPRAGAREIRDELPATVRGVNGVYRRSVACADDGAVRYVWSDDARPER
jgi:hypothetical protein